MEHKVKLLKLLEEEREEKESDAGAMKFDANKPRMGLLEPEFLEGVANVLGFGASKYEYMNWKKGISSERLYGALLRHITASMKGEDIDPESGLDHLHHAACNLMYLSWMLKNRPDLDTRGVNENRSNS